jgi:hypothetical protein
VPCPGTLKVIPLEINSRLESRKKQQHFTKSHIRVVVVVVAAAAVAVSAMILAARMFPYCSNV